jgi:predicted DsbA family dithiol-disulfide isomerase
MTRPVVEVFADVACPFTHVGLRRVVARRAELGRSEPVLRVRAWPLELVNGALDCEAITQHVGELREQVAPDLFRGFDPSVFPSSSLPAMALASTAYDLGNVLGERVSLAVRDAIFEEGRDIADPAVLDAIAAAYGVGARGPDAESTVLGDFEEGKRRGVRGSPEFFLDDQGWFCPALRIEEVDGKLKIAPDPAGFEAFLSDCFR